MPGNLLNTVELAQEGTAFDAFGRLRVSRPYPIFSAKLLHDKEPIFFDEVLAGGATSAHNSGEATVSMGVSSNGEYAIRQTFMRFNYQPGKGHQIFLTGVLGEPVANTESRIGYFNTSTSAPYTANMDGVYFGQDGTNKYIAISRNGTENKIIQTNWNGDKLDGTGASGVMVDWDENQIWFLDLEWLGAGIVRFGQVINGVFIVCHTEDHTNGAAAFTGAYTQSPNHSIRYEVRSTGGTLTMKQGCCSVASEGGEDAGGITRGVGNGITAVTCGTTLEGILFLRLNSGRPDISLAVESLSVLDTANNAGNFRWELVRNPTIAGTALSYSNVSGSAVDYAVGNGDNTISGGDVLAYGYGIGDVPGVNVSPRLLVHPGIALDGTQDEIALAVQMFTGTDDFVGAFNVRELTCG